MLKPNRLITNFQASGQRVQRIFVFLFLSTALIIALVGAMAMVQVESSIQSSRWNQLTSQVTPQTLLMAMEQDIPYLRENLRQTEHRGILTRLFFELATSINPRDPRTLIGRELPMFALFDVDIVKASPGVDFTSIPVESPPPPEIEAAIIQGTKKNEEKEPVPATSNQVFIYHTHYWESYLPEVNKKKASDSVSLEKHKNINMVGKHFERALEKRNIAAQVSTTQPKTNSRTAYRTSRKKVVAAIQQNDNLQYIIDLHRDSQPRSKTTLTIDGKQYAKLAFVVGKSSKYYKQNRKLAQQLHERINQLYPGLSRAVIEKPKTRGINGEYNQSLLPNSLLVEVGGVGNYFSEAYRSVDVLAKVLSEEILQATPVSNVK